jgi:competence protein ComEC
MDAVRNTAVSESISEHVAVSDSRYEPGAVRNLTRYQPLVTVTLACAAGIIVDRYVNAAPSFGVAWLLAAACLFVWWFAWRMGRGQMSAWPLLAAVAMTGAAWHHAQWQLYDRDEIGRFATYQLSPVCVEVVAQQSPELVSAPAPNPMRAIPQGEKSRLLVDVTRIRDGANWRPASGACQLAVEGHVLGIHQGDVLRVFGQLARIAPPLNPGEFDFAEHARADRQFVRVRSSLPECVTILAHGSSWSPGQWLDAVRSRAKQGVRSLIGPNRAGLAAAILLGAREGLPFEETESYLVTGTIHVLVVSGMNVAILVAGFWLMMRMGWLSRRAGILLVIFIAVAYALLAETQPPVVRAALLAVLMGVAVWTGRMGLAVNSLFGVALIVLLMNPNDLFRAGPQLSFLAVAALIWISEWPMFRKVDAPDRLEELIAAARPWYIRGFSAASKWLALLLLTSLVVWLTALPLVLNQVLIFSPIAIAIAIPVWLFVWFAMWTGFGMLFGALVPAIGALCGTFCNWSLAGLDAIVHWAESAPAGHMWLPGPAWWWVAVFYAGLLAVMFWGHGFPKRWQLAALSVWILVGLAPLVIRSHARNNLECSFVAVGHGECVLIETPDGENLLYDAGAIGSPEFAVQSISSFLWDRGIMRIDGIVVSHSDSDHYNAIPGLLERFRVGTIYVSPVMFRAFADEGPNALRDAIHRAGVPIREIWSGDRLRAGNDVTIHVLHPPKKGVLGSDNANSLTMGVEYAGRRVLLPGDLESPGIDDLMAEVPYDCDVLLAPHHGSRRSDPPGFAAWTTPELVVISSGGRDQIGPVVHTYEGAGALVFATNEVGTVRFSITPDSDLQTTTWRGKSSP